MRKLLYVAVAVSALLMLMLAAATPAMAASVGRWAGQADNTGTGPSWTDLSNATGSQNGGYASVDIAPKGHSGNLTLTYFGFTSSDIPAGSTLSSIKVDVYCSGTSQIQDYGVYLVNGSSSSNNKAVTTSWNTSSQPISHNYTISGWGIASWTLADIVGNDNFGVSISAYNNHGTLSRTAYVDAVRITVYYTPAGGPGGGVGGGIPVTLDLVGSIGGDGVVSGDQEYTTPDGGATLDIPDGTQVLGSSGGPVTSIVAVAAPPWGPIAVPGVPQGACLVSFAYEFTPAGATFNPPAVLTIKYPTDLAELQSLCPGVTLTDPPNIVIAYYDSVLGWTVIPSWVDTTNHTVSGNVSHFTKFALYSPPPAPEPTPTLAPVEVPVVTEAPLPTAAPVEVPVVTEAPSPTAAPVVAPSPTEAPTPAPAPAAEANKTNIGVIVGPIVAVIIIALVAYWFLSRRKKAPVAK